jgi:hypothetical protein
LTGAAWLVLERRGIMLRELASEIRMVLCLVQCYYSDAFPEDCS